MKKFKQLQTLLFVSAAVLSLSACSKIKQSAIQPLVATISTFAGNTTQGSADGAGTTASFYRPSGIAVDAQGNIFVGDAGNNLIRKITSNGLVSTFAGSGSQGSADGTGTAASFNDPQGIAGDASGNLYVADALNKLIRKITPAGVVTTLAGGGVAGTDGPGTEAGFRSPTGVAVDANGNVFVADSYTIRKITAAGIVSTFAGGTVPGSADGNGNTASFKMLIGIAVDLQGNLYVTDSGNNLIRKITRQGTVSTLAGSGSAGSADGTGTAATFNAPISIAADAAGYVYVGDSSHLIRAINPQGVVVTIAGTGAAGSDNGLAGSSTFSIPYGLAVGNNSLFIGDTFNNMIRKFAYQ